MKLSIDPVLKVFIKRAYLENYERNFYNVMTLVTGVVVLIFVFSLLLLPSNDLNIPSNPALYSRILYETYGISLPPSKAVVVLTLIPIIIFFPSVFTLILSSSIPYYFLYNLRMNSEIEIFLSYLGGPKRVFSIITKASLIFTLIYYTIYYGETTVLILLFIPVLLSSIQFLILFYIGGLVIILLTLLLIIILSLKFPSLSKPSTSFGRSVPPSLSIATLVSVAEFVLFETINAMFVSYSQITTLLIIGFNSSIVLILAVLFMKFRGSVTAEDFISR